jgi:hypothetical protein
MPVQPQPQTNERRRIVRQKSFLRGTIHFNNRRSALDCLVRDISRFGARLTFTNAATVPDVIELHIPQKEQTLRAHIIWRHGQEVGIAFASETPIEASAESGDIADRVQRLETEVASLKRLVRQMKSEHEFEPD